MPNASIARQPTQNVKYIKGGPRMRSRYRNTWRNLSLVACLFGVPNIVVAQQEFAPGVSSAYEMSQENYVKALDGHSAGYYSFVLVSINSAGQPSWRGCVFAGALIREFEISENDADENNYPSNYLRALDKVKANNSHEFTLSSDALARLRTYSPIEARRAEEIIGVLSKDQIVQNGYTIPLPIKGADEDSLPPAAFACAMIERGYVVYQMQERTQEIRVLSDLK
ncbi:MAG: hypothetical protein JWM33_1601 [Caulobacteraceae bacterium]|nr:hypothetical protein [Caulobacteraceae bacterium]